MEFNHRQYAALVEADKLLGIDPDEGQSGDYRRACEKYTQEVIASQKERHFLESKGAPCRPNWTPKMISEKANELRKIIDYLQSVGEDTDKMNYTAMIQVIDMRRASQFIDEQSNNVPNNDLSNGGSPNDDVTVENKSTHYVIADADVVVSYIAIFGQEKYDSLPPRRRKDVPRLRKQIIAR